MHTKPTPLIACLAALISAAPLTALGLTVSSGTEGPPGLPHTCDIISWADSAGTQRTTYLVRVDGVYNNTYVGGFFTRYIYQDGVTTVDAKELVQVAQSGFGQLVNHYNPASGLVSRSKTHGTNATDEVVFQGAHHLIRRVSLDQYAEDDHVNGKFHATYDYFFREGDDAIVYAITYDTTGHPLGVFSNDSRSPYCNIDWDGSGSFADGITGFEYGRDFKFICPSIATGSWTYTEANIVPYVWEWKDSLDREIGYVQTQTFGQHVGGDVVHHGTSGSALPPAWQLAYQMNGYSGYTDNKITWGLPFGSVDGGFGSSDYYQNYSVSLVLDPLHRGGVTNLLAETERIHAGNVTLSAADGGVVTEGPEGAACPNGYTYSPAGYDHVYRVWRASMNAANQASLNLAVSGGTVANPTFVLHHYYGAAAPSQLTWNGAALTADTDYYASVDDARDRLYLTVLKSFTASNQLVVTAPSAAGFGENLLVNGGFAMASDGTSATGPAALEWHRWGEGTRENWSSKEGDGYLATLHNWGGSSASSGWRQDVPVAAGTHYVLSGYFSADASYTYADVLLKMEFYDAAMGSLGATTTRVSGVGGTWSYRQTEGDAPAGAKWARAVVSVSGQGFGGSLKFDALKLVAMDTSGLARLEPAEGCYTGANLQWDKASPVQFNAKVGWDHVCFVDFTGFPLADYSSLDAHMGQVNSVGGIYVLTLEPANAEGGLSNITSNDCAAFAGWCAYWNSAGVPVVIRFAHEMNGDWYDWRMQPRTYREKFRLLADSIHQTATNTALLWAPNVAGSYPYGVYGNMTKSVYTNGYGTLADWFLLDSNGDGVLSDTVGQKDDPYGPFYPGDAYVDWVGMTIYHWGSYWPWHYNAWPEARKLSSQITGTFSGFNGDETWNPDFYALFAEGHGKPMMIPETAAFYRPANAPNPGGYPNYTNDEVYIKQLWLEQVFNVFGDNANALDVADHFPLLKSINWFDQYKVESEADNDWVDWSVTSNSTVTSEYYGRLNAMKNGRRHFLHADDLAGYVYSWNSSLEGWSAGGPPFSVALDTNLPYHGRTCLRVDYDDASSPYGKTVMADFAAIQDAMSWSNHNAVYLWTRVPTNVAWATYRLIMQSAATNSYVLASLPGTADGAWHKLVFPYDNTVHAGSSWMNLYLQVDLPTGQTAQVYLDALSVAADNDADGQADGDDPDDDNDGMSDLFESTYGLNPFDAADALLDPDGDGLNNRQEAHVDTNPTNAASLLSMDIEEGALSGDVHLWWSGRSGITYEVQSSPFPTGTWVTSAGPMVTNIHTTLSYTHNVGTQTQGFYRVKVP